MRIKAIENNPLWNWHEACIIYCRIWRYLHRVGPTLGIPVMKTIIRNLTILSALIGVFGLAQTAHAVPVVFNGATADLSLVGTTSNADGSTTYQVVYSFNFAGWDTSCDESLDSCGAVHATHLGAIDFSFGGPENPLAVLVSTNAPGVWTGFDVVANANGCAGGGHNSVCTQVDDPSLVAIAGGNYEWVFDITFEDYVPNFEDAAVRAWFLRCYTGEGCDNAGLMSLRTTSVPEPATLGMLGTSLLLLGFSRRRRKT